MSYNYDFIYDELQTSIWRTYLIIWCNSLNLAMFLVQFIPPSSGMDPYTVDSDAEIMDWLVSVRIKQIIFSGNYTS